MYFWNNIHVIKFKGEDIKSNSKWRNLFRYREVEDKGETFMQYCVLVQIKKVHIVYFIAILDPKIWNKPPATCK